MTPTEPNRDPDLEDNRYPADYDDLFDASGELVETDTIEEVLARLKT